MKSRLKFTIFTLALLLSVFPTFASAQIPASIDGVQISTYPQIPAPGQSVTIEVESFSTDLNAASIIWLVDGKTTLQGTGKKSLTVTAPALGKKMNITAVIMTVEKREVRKVVTINPGRVDLVWESGGFVPPLYKGKADFAYENKVRITAIPSLADTSGNQIDPKILLYKWTRNDKVVQAQSGYGKQTLEIQEEIPRDQVILVEVSTPTGTAKATARITLVPGEPSISFYEEDPLYGVLYNKAVTDRLTLTNQEATIRAVPYTFNFSKETPLSFTWSINNLERPDLSTKESITLRTKGDAAGSSNIFLEVRNAKNILQSAKAGINVQFNKKQTSTNSFTF